MDTVTHAVTGLALGALAQGISGTGNDQTHTALMWAALVASQAPDFDVLVRLIGGKTSYLKYHRTFTHTLPIMIISSGILTIFLKYFYPLAVWQPVFIWSLIAMLIHVLMDLTTSYGTKALWPLNKNMLALDWVMIVDPVILLILGGAVAVWYFNSLPTIPLFVTTFTITLIYIIIRGFLHKTLVESIQKRYTDGTCSVIPTFSINNWNFVIEKEMTDNAKLFIVGSISLHPRKIVVEKEYTCTGSPQLSVAKQSNLGKTFVNFARHLAVWQQQGNNGTIITLADLRFRFGDKYPFAAHIGLNDNLQVTKESLSFSDEKMIKAAVKDDIEKW
jgi:inner membrane protein